MKKDKYIKSDDHLSPLQMEKFVNGTLSVFEHDEVQKHLEECEFCSDAIEGLKQFPSDFNTDVSELNLLIDKKVSSSKTSYTYWAVAATFALLLVSSIIFFLNLPEKKAFEVSDITVSGKDEKKLDAKNDVSLIPKDNNPVRVEKPLSGRKLEPKDYAFSQDKNKSEVSGESDDNSIAMEAMPEPKKVVEIDKHNKEVIEQTVIEMIALVSKAQEMPVYDAIMADEDGRVKPTAPSVAAESKSMAPAAQMKKLKAVRYDRSEAPAATSAPVSSREENVAPIRKRDFKAQYDSSHYQEAINILNSDRKNLDMTGYKYLILSYIQLNETDKAVAEADNLSLFRRDAEPLAIWLKATAFLKSGEKEKAFPLLEELSQGNTHYRKVSSDILQKLKN